jgi:tetratricopeptide (TPR) repeat protein
MLLREDRYELALSQIDNALVVQPDAGMLHHTRGTVLSKIALSSASADIGRRRLVQAEAAFQEAIKRKKKDGYPYHGLALLYFNWAKRFAENDEVIDYIGRSEKVIADAIRVVHDRERLLLLSSDIEAWLGNQPKALAILEKAASSSVGVYMLAGLYLQQRRFADAKNVLAPAVLADPTDERLAMQYAKTLLGLGAKHSEAIAVLKLAELYGMRDARYVAMLGGLLFVDGKFTESQKVFAESLKMRFPIDEQQAIGFRPRDAADFSKRLHLRGEVAKAQWGFAFIRVPGMPDVFCRRIRLKGKLLSAGDKVHFNLAFNTLGAIAEDIGLQ